MIKIIPIHNIRLLYKSFRILKYLRAVREQEEDILIGEFEDNCYFFEEWNYLI